MAYPKTIPVLTMVKDSSSVQGISYDTKTRFLFISFLPTKGNKEGPLYRYKDVPKGTWNRFSQSTSKGMFLWTHLRDKFPYARWTGSGWRKETALKKASAAKKKRASQ